MSRATVRQYAAHLEAGGRPRLVPRSPDVNSSWRRSARGSPVERTPEEETAGDPSAGANASLRFAGTPLRSVSKAQPDDDRLAVTLTVAELRELVREVAL